ncbi:tol-pal system protein YbgF [Sulfitobacter sp. KE34]|uniref:Cell division coordinator CpoB n=1 Tax=Sulfitobacter faviae TaxID=1775881 RepID=A0AAX3LUE8_9RHOB|nr:MULTISPECIES: tol-pal system protein YbgF [Sulfitobacter]MDF3348820.1 tol-pal system protein YbgF [Sulfitobacter sp. KE12]MDF3352491.1 tol-pal system protein YbgF [Sulfitobacter sp. KE27]MDF3356138.1 tol-pal system protein YbgF [Sulfitobacter sp. KE33]MDF3360566.1 tol-pal system protein YbgF [Sulfitobacter sp. Ks41]MDF3363562.1 tol-pal system protein YbgF [Sulfitobacter sp. Ks34]
MGLMTAPAALMAQDNDQTLADIRQQLTVLNVEVQKLRRELSTTGGASVETGGNSVLERVSTMESELQRLTSKTEEMENRINRIVADGTNRIGDLEYRLVELEGGDLGALGETSTLGGGEAPAVAAPAPEADREVVEVTPGSGGAGTSGGIITPINEAELAVSEKADFERAQEALASGDFRSAADLFASFNTTYPGGPLAAEAEMRRGEALTGLGDNREAARAYLAAFSTDPEGPVAPRSLFELGRALGVLEQTQEACVTLSEVAVRFPNAPQVSQAEAQRQTLGCS